VVRRLQNVYVAATDLDQAVRFYREALGLRLKFRDGNRWAQFDLGETSFAVSAPPKARPPRGAGAVAVFEVESLEAAVVALQSAGAPIQSGVVDMGSHGRILTVRDPAGNPIQLFQRAPS